MVGWYVEVTNLVGFKLSWTHPKDELIIKKMLSSSSLSKIKRYFPEMVGEKRGK